MIPEQDQGDETRASKPAQGVPSLPEPNDGVWGPAIIAIAVVVALAIVAAVVRHV